MPGLPRGYRNLLNLMGRYYDTCKHTCRCDLQNMQESRKARLISNGAIFFMWSPPLAGSDVRIAGHLQPHCRKYTPLARTLQEPATAPAGMICKTWQCCWRTAAKTAFNCNSPMSGPGVPVSQPGLIIYLILFGGSFMLSLCSSHAPARMDRNCNALLPYCPAVSRSGVK